MKLYDIDIEHSVLGSIMLDPNYCIPIAVSSGLTDSDFYNEENRNTFKAMMSLFAKNIGIDVLMVRNECPSLSLSVLSCLADSIPSAKAIKDYCNEVKSFSIRRSIVGKINTLHQTLLDDGDADAVIDSFMNDVATVKQSKQSGTVHINDVLQDVYNNIKRGKDYGFRTGFKCLDQYEKGLHRGRLYVVATGTGKGKTAWVSNLVVNSITYEQTVLFISVEMTVSEIVARLIAIASETPNRYSDEYMENTPMWTEESKKEMQRNRIQGIGRLSDSDIYIDDRPLDMFGINAVARDMQYKLQRKNKTLDLIVVDYLQLIKPSTASKSFNREQEVGAIADGLKLLAKSLHVPVVALAQTNRLAEKDERDYCVGDLRESARIEQNADMILFLNRNEEDKSKFNLTCAKNRHGMGFKQAMHFESDTLKFTEVEEEQK